MLVTLATAPAAPVVFVAAAATVMRTAGIVEIAVAT